MKKLTLLIVIAVITTFINVSSQAADKPAPAEKGEAKEKFRPFRGTIKSIDTGGRIITLDGEKAQTFAIAADAKLTKDGKPASVGDLAVGDIVGGRAKESGEGKWTAVTVNAGKRGDKAPADKESK